MIWYLILLVVVGLTLGPVGRLQLTTDFTPDLVIIFLWAATLFNNRNASLGLAVIAGVLIDIIMFNSFGAWTISLVLVVLLVDWLKKRYLDSSSIIHSVTALALASFIPAIVFYIAYNPIALTELGIKIFANVFFGSFVYYIFASKTNLFQRWAGRRI